MEDIEEIRQKKLAELQRRLEEERNKQAAEQSAEIQKQLILRSILTPEARSRLTNLRLSRPEYASTIEAQLISLAQSGKLVGKVTDAQLKEILRQLAQSRSRTTTIRRL